MLIIENVNKLLSHIYFFLKWDQIAHAIQYFASESRIYNIKNAFSVPKTYLRREWDVDLVVSPCLSPRQAAESQVGLRVHVVHIAPHFWRALVHSGRVDLTLPSSSGSRIPKSWAGVDLKVQPQEPLVLKGVENTDWYLLQGDTDVRIEVRHWAGSLTPISALQGHRPT